MVEIDDITTTVHTNTYHGFFIRETMNDRSGFASKHIILTTSRNASFYIYLVLGLQGTYLRYLWYFNQYGRIADDVVRGILRGCVRASSFHSFSLESSLGMIYQSAWRRLSYPHSSMLWHLVAYMSYNTMWSVAQCYFYNV